MNVCVINGSPRGRYSITLQTLIYLEKRFPSHTFCYIDAGQGIRKHERDISEALSAMRAADLLIFAYPVYTFIAPSQLHRFIELVKASGEDFSDKYATQITTSKHFYDVTAQRYVEDNCHDMNMRVIRGLSADMDDLLSDKGRGEAEAFFGYVDYCVQNGLCEPRPRAERREPPPYTPSLAASPKAGGFDTVIVADVREGDDDLRAMIADFEAVYPYPTRLVNIAEYPFQGGCLGCFNCAGEGKCIYKDGFDSFLRESVQTANAVVYAFTIRDHSMGAVFKTFDDRQFCNGHRTVTEGMPFGYIARGDYEAEPNLRMIIEARCEVGHNFLAGVGTDAGTISLMAERLGYALRSKYVQPRNFYGVGGMKIFRDLIWTMRGLMKADHDFYKKRGLYDFPQKHRASMLKMCLLGALVRNPKLKSKMGDKFNKGMVAPYKAVIAAATPADDASQAGEP